MYIDKNQFDNKNKTIFNETGSWNGEDAIDIILKSLQKLKVLFEKEKNKSSQQEIEFFKNVKPKFTSKLIYYNVIFKIETKKPHGGERIIKRKYIYRRNKSSQSFN